MRICLTDRNTGAAPDLRLAGELAPSLALPWVVRLRYGILLGQAALILAANYVFGVSLRIGWLSVPLAVMAASNLLFHRAAERVGVRPALGSFLVLDILSLTALLALSGGPANPFTVLYLVQITLSAVILSRAWTWGLGLLSMACFASLFPLHFHVSIFEGHYSSDSFSVHLIGMWIAFAAGSLLVTIFIGKVSEALRRGEQEVLALQSRLARHERLASIATLAAGAAHELGSPMATIAIAAKDLENAAAESPREPTVGTDARLIRAQIERCRQILIQMSAGGAEPQGECPTSVDLNLLLDQVRADSPSSARIVTHVTTDGQCSNAVLPHQASKQALAALVKNALDSSPEGRPVTISATELNDKVRFSIADSGCGMSAETLQRIGEPFYTTKPPGQGMGLGIFLVRAFAERMGGNLEFESEQGRGTTVILEILQERT